MHFTPKENMKFKRRQNRILKNDALLIFHFSKMSSLDKINFPW